MTLYILKINKYLSYFHSFLLTSAFITDNFLIMADDVRCPDVTSSWRIFTKLSEYVYLTKILNLCKFCVNPIIFSGKYGHKRAKISWNMRKMRKSTCNHNIVKNDPIDLKIGQNWDIIDVNWFWHSYENLSNWRHVTSHDGFFAKMW